LTDEGADGAPGIKGVILVEVSLVTEELDGVLAKGYGAFEVAHFVCAAKLLGIFYDDGLGGGEGD
jgi:hypothetical protein